MRTKTEDRKTKNGNADSELSSLPFFGFRFSYFVLTAFWRWLRAVSGDDAYERYAATLAGDEPCLSPGEFYRQRLERKYSRPCRCC
jgi:uncharacterized short protein YbdD (DUF466 family)